MSTDQKEKEYLAPTASGASSAAEQRQTAPAARRLLATAGAAPWPLFSSPAGDTPLLAPCPCSFCAWTAGWTSNGGISVPQEPVLPPTHRQETSPPDKAGSPGWGCLLRSLCAGRPPELSPEPPHTGHGPPWAPLTLPRWPGDRDTLAPALWGLPPSPCLVPHQGQSPGTAGPCPARGLSVGLCRGSQHPKPGPRGEGRALCDGRQRAEGPARHLSGFAGAHLPPARRGLLIPGRGLLTAVALSPLGVTVPTKAAAPPLSPIIKNNISATAVSWFG